MAAACLCVVVLGVIISTVSPLNLGISSEFNLKIPDEMMSTTMIAVFALDELMVGLIGYLMQTLGLKMFFISLFVLGLLICINSRYLLCLHQREEVLSEKEPKEINEENK